MKTFDFDSFISIFFLGLEDKVTVLKLKFVHLLADMLFLTALSCCDKLTMDFDFCKID